MGMGSVALFLPCRTRDINSLPPSRVLSPQPNQAGTFRICECGAVWTEGPCRWKLRTLREGDHPELSLVGLKSKHCVLYKKGDLRHTQRRCPGGHRDRGWTGVATSPGRLEPRELGKAGRTLP